jgi:hypothetical protein
MRSPGIPYSLLGYLLVSICVETAGYSQTVYNTIIQGKVIDAKTKEAIPFASVFLENTTVGTITDSKGTYKIVTSKTSYKITFSFIGYDSESRVITPGKTQTINIELYPSSIELSEVQVRPPKKKYSNKGNPAVDLIENVIKHKNSNRKESLDYFSYDKYEKLVLAVSNINDKFEQRKIFRKFKFIFDNVDTNRIEGNDDLPIFMKETESSYFYRKTPKSDKTIIKGEKTINFDEFVDIKGLVANLNYLYQNINIYDNSIFFLSNSFLSPVASTSPVLYRYFIQDTVSIDEVRYIKLFFEPRNPADFLFHGFLYITNDSTYALKKVDISFNKGINIDWIKDVRIIQDFDNFGQNSWLLTKDEILIDFGITQNLPGLLGHRTVSYNHYSVNEQIPDSLFRGMEVVREPDAPEKKQVYWESVRNPPLDRSEKNIYDIVDSVKKVPAFRHKVQFVNMVTTNFLTLNKVEFGPDDVLYSYNPVEGSRFRLGGRTTAQFNKRIYFDSYLAYGFKDKLYKYGVGATYSIPGTSIYKFPVKSIRLNYRYDTQIPGQILLATESDNIFYSIKRGVNDKLFYSRTYGFEFQNEYENHLSFNLGYNYNRLVPGGNLYFVRGDSFSTPNKVAGITAPEIFLQLRYAHNEEFHQGKLYREAVPSKYPVLQIQYIAGSKLLGNDYNYQKIQLGISKRFYYSIFGYSDISAQAGRIFGKVSYPLLFIANANQSYSYETNSYNMMNFMEFVSDRYVSLQIDHSFNGFFFNKVPLLKRLKLREVVTFKALYGRLGTNNDPSLQPDLYKFPLDSNGLPLTYTLEARPYIEASVGVSNIFRIFRVDLVKRFTYLGNPNVPSIGIRLSFKFDF